MIRTRTYPFGYALENGAVTVQKREAAAVKRIYAAYAHGNSIETIAQQMAASDTPYSPENGAWNKHKVRRILENACYTGAKGYPVILDNETFQQVRSLYVERTQAWQSLTANPERYVWKRLICGSCGERVTRIGGRGNKETILVCTSCGMRVEYDTAVLRETLLERAKDCLPVAATTEAEPNPALLRLHNEINRQLEKPSDPAIVRDLILQAAAERYAALPKLPTEETEMDWRRLKEMAKQIVIFENGDIHINGARS